MKQGSNMCRQSLAGAKIFVCGAVFGAIIAIGMPGLASEDKNAVGTVTAILYALAELAVDTEANAAKLVLLEQRIDDLEADLNENTGAASQK